MAQSPFCIVPTGLPPITQPTSQPAPTSYLFTLPTIRPFNHIVVFLLPGVELPPDTAAAVYINIPIPSSTSPGNANTNGTAAGEFKFLGGIGTGKESAVFKISGLLPSANTNAVTPGGEIDMDAPEDSPTGPITIGISLEPAASVAAQMATLQQSTSTVTPSNSSTALVLASQGVNQLKKPDTLLLAQRIIKNAFNFLASFSGNVNGGVEVVPLKAFEDWWRKFEGRVKNDPGFLERDGD